MKRTDERLVSTAVFIFSFVLRKKSTTKVWKEWTNHADYDLRRPSFVRNHFTCAGFSAVYTKSTFRKPNVTIVGCRRQASVTLEVETAIFIFSIFLKIKEYN